MEKFNYQEPTEEDLNNIYSEDLPPDQRKRHKIQREENINGESHHIEIEYEEIRPGVWKKVHRSEKDLGQVDNTSQQ